MSDENQKEVAEETINIDNVSYKLSELSQDVKIMIATYRSWERKEVDVRDELVRFQAAKQTLSAQIISKVTADNAEKAEKPAETEINTTEPVAPGSA